MNPFRVRRANFDTFSIAPQVKTEHLVACLCEIIDKRAFFQVPRVAILGKAMDQQERAKGLATVPACYLEKEKMVKKKKKKKKKERKKRRERG